MIGATIGPVALPVRTRLLLIDDCISERDLYECVLRAQFEIMTAARGDLGIELAESAHPDVVVLDVKMPGLDGFETCRQLRSNTETTDIPVILLTGADDPDLAQRAIEVGATGLLKKPCSVDRLNEMIQSCIDDRHRV